jgi:hypothetical protein
VEVTALGDRLFGGQHDRSGGALRESILVIEYAHDR